MFQLKLVKEQVIKSEKYKDDGVGLVLKPLDVPLRASVEMVLAGPRGQLFDMQLENESLGTVIDPWLTMVMGKDGKDIPPDTLVPPEVERANKRRLELYEQSAIIHNGVIYPTWIRLASKKVLGVETDAPGGKREATPEELAASAPVEMIVELGKMITDLVYVRAEVQENLEQPTTSNGVGGGPSLVTSATTAKPATSTSTVTAQDIFKKAFDSPSSSGLSDSGTISSTSEGQS